jgi:nitrogen regulatory protein PII
MKLFVAVIEEEEDLDEILEAFKEIGIQGVTILDSMGTGHLLTEDVSIFGRLTKFTESNKKSNKTLFTVVKDERTMEKVVTIIEEIVGDLDHRHSAFFFTLSLNQVKGLTTL